MGIQHELRCHICLKAKRYHRDVIAVKWNKDKFRVHCICLNCGNSSVRGSNCARREMDVNDATIKNNGKIICVINQRDHDALLTIDGLISFESEAALKSHIENCNAALLILKEIQKKG